MVFCGEGWRSGGVELIETSGSFPSESVILEENLM